MLPQLPTGRDDVFLKDGEALSTRLRVPVERSCDQHLLAADFLLQHPLLNAQRITARRDDQRLAVGFEQQEFVGSGH